jgi:pimeloyl-ACP methyl ester carboxylesterase
VSISYRPPRSQWVDLDGPFHYVDHGGPTDGPLLVCIHGLGGSLVNWAALAPRLTDRARVLALDLPGFGRTRAAGRPTSVAANQKLLNRFLRAVADGPAVLVGNSMGGLIATMQAGTHPETVAGTVLIGPALPRALGARPDPFVTAMFAMYAVPPLGRVLLQGQRRGDPEQTAMDRLRLCCVDTDRVPAPVLRQHVALARVRRTYDDVDDALLEAARSVMWVLARRRHHLAMQAAVTSPVLLLHGARDRLVPVASARAAARAHPTWRFQVAEDVGHVPQLEAPGWTAECILDWLETGALAAATPRQPTTPPPSTDPGRNNA